MGKVSHWRAVICYPGHHYHKESGAVQHQKNCLKPLYMDNCHETCQQRVYFYLGQFSVWMLNVSDFSAVVCTRITKEVYHCKTIQSCLKPSSVDNFPRLKSCCRLYAAPWYSRKYIITRRVTTFYIFYMWTIDQTHVSSDSTLAICVMCEYGCWIFVADKCAVTYSVRDQNHKENACFITKRERTVRTVLSLRMWTTAKTHVSSESILALWEVFEYGSRILVT